MPCATSCDVWASCSVTSPTTWSSTLPHHGDDPFHWHVHVVPRVHSVGGFEQGTGVPINIVAPEDACRLLAG